MKNASTANHADTAAREFLFRCARDYPVLPHRGPGDAEVRAKADHLLANPDWRTFLQWIHSWPSLNRSGGLQVFVDELAGVSDYRMNPFAGTLAAMEAFRVEGRHLADHLALSLYAGGGSIGVARNSMLFRQLERVRWIALGRRETIGDAIRDGLAGVERVSPVKIDNVLPTELANRRLYAAKRAMDEVIGWRRPSGKTRDPLVRVRIVLDVDSLRPRVLAGRGSALSWARAFALWFLHDLTCHLARFPGLILHGVVELGTTASSFAPLTVNLSDIPRGAVLAEEPFLDRVPELLPFLMRTFPSGDAAPAFNPKAESEESIMDFFVWIGAAKDRAPDDRPDRAVLMLVEDSCVLRAGPTVRTRRTAYPPVSVAPERDPSFESIRLGIVQAFVTELLSMATQQ